jgi:hypothetical protein
MADDKFTIYKFTNTNHLTNQIIALKAERDNLVKERDQLRAALKAKQP